MNPINSKPPVPLNPATANPSNPSTPAGVPADTQSQVTNALVAAGLSFENIKAAVQGQMAVSDLADKAANQELADNEEVRNVQSKLDGYNAASGNPKDTDPYMAVLKNLLG